MKNIIITLLIVCCFSVVNAQSKKEIIQELTNENSNLKQEISSLKDKIILLDNEILALKKELVVDKVQTPQEYGKTLFDLFVSQRLTKYPELQFQLKDTVYFRKESFKNEINNFKNNSIEFYLDGTNKGIDWTKAKFKRVEFETGKPDKDIKIFYLSGRIFFELFGKEYSFKNEASILENGKWRGYYFDDLVNISEELEIEKKEKQEKLNQPYAPEGIEFGPVIISYNQDEVNPKTMRNLKIPIENKTGYAIDWVKFQFRIYDSGDLILSKNIIIGEYSSGFDSKLEPGEKEIIELNDIGEVFIGSGVKNEKWYTDVKLLEAKPKQIEN